MKNEERRPEKAKGRYYRFFYRHPWGIDVAAFILSFGITNGICFLFDYLKINDLNFIIVYIMGIILTGFFTNTFIYSTLQSIFSVVFYNLFFTTPRFTLGVSDLQYLITFFLMLIVGLFISALTYSYKKHMKKINELNLRNSALRHEADIENARGTLLRSISHDLRTPLTSMKTGADLLLNHPELEQRQKDEILKDISSKSEWTIRLVENLLTLTRIDSKKMTVKKKPEALEEVIPEAVRGVNGIIGGRKIHYDMPTGLVFVDMDATLITQVIINILTNAIQHTKDDGNIWIKVFDSGFSYAFWIENDGTPIADYAIDHVFEMYYTTNERQGGIGVGLAICKMIVEAHGGEISCLNTKDGHVRFEFILPKEEKSNEQNTGNRR